MHPVDYPHRILLAVVGASPQVVTETLYALLAQQPPFVPTEVILVTTRLGADRLQRALFDCEPSPFRQMLEDYQWPDVPFDASSIRVVQDSAGQPLADIRSEQDNEALADCITDQVRSITSDEDSALHVSIAGGRKSMSFFAGYVLTLFGRQQDELSHVLVDESLVGTDFFYPRPGDDVDVALAKIPFVPLLSGMSSWIRESGRGFAETIAAMRSADQGEPKLVLDVAHRLVSANGEVFELSPVNMAFLIVMAQRVLEGRAGYSRVGDEEEDQACGEEFVSVLLQVCDEWGDMRSVEAVQRAGKLDVSSRDQRKNQLNRRLKQRLGKACAEPYCIVREGTNERGQKLFGLTLKPEQILFADLADGRASG